MDSSTVAIIYSTFTTATIIILFTPVGAMDILTMLVAQVVAMAACFLIDKIVRAGMDGR